MPTDHQESPGSYGCFRHPSSSFERKRLDDVCPDCNLPYEFPLVNYPRRIRDFVIQKPLSRGFYGAIYIATYGPFEKYCVLKVIPTEVYLFHDKNFKQECHMHNDVAEGTDHVVGISDFFDEDVSFGDNINLRCHIAVLDYVDGSKLDEFLTGDSKIGATTLAQLAVDVFRLLQLLERKKVYHNDLHHKNLIVQKLSRDQFRSEAIDEEIRLVAVDLGSLADRSRSGPPRRALGDLASAASFLVEFATPLLTNPDETPDSDYRLASVLAELSTFITGDAASIRTPDYDEFINQIREAYSDASSPWRSPVGLRRLNDAYNAQTLHPYFIPKLLVDPDGEWLAAVSTGGPQVITGVRGCGKTMLLRALQFHVRLSKHQDSNDDENSVIDLIRQDGYLGLYLSARRLLDALENQNRSDGVLHEPYARLLIGYAREGVRACRHLAEIDRMAIYPKWWERLARSVTEVIANTETKRISAAMSPDVLERRLHAMLFSLDRGESEHKLLVNPSIAFPELAKAISSVSPAWEANKVLFLLDDVSTRHLEERSIATLLSTLMFNDDCCAFKLTTEGQTLELALKSPGLVERARADRDYEPFDLAARVNERLKKPSKGKQFLSDILELRAKQFKRHPTPKPIQLLGDESLENIARHIVETEKSAGERKRLYWGLSALVAVCVGDIGDVLNIYDSMLRKITGNGGGQIPAEVQNAAFQEYSSRRLYHLSRQKVALKDYAIAFAEAAHDLLQRSAHTCNGSSVKRKRLRQYAQLYVRITTGDAQQQFDRLRELIDAGVFVLESGVDSPRMKTRDSDPISQFILTYRKLFGLTQYIGLAFSDRFELSGEQLEHWLSNPAKGKDILMKNLGGPLRIEETARESTKNHDHNPLATSPKQLNLLDLDQPIQPGDGIQPRTVSNDSPNKRWMTLDIRVPTARVLTEDRQVTQIGVQIAVLGLGFEERCLASARKLFAAVGSVENTIVIRYNEKGFSEKIEAIARHYSKDLHIIDYKNLRPDAFELSSGPIVVDVTGLAKPAIFHSIQHALLSDQQVIVVHTEAENHYPCDSDIKEVFKEDTSDNIYQILEQAGKIWSGERIPYRFVPLLSSDSDDSRHCLLCAAVSAKHERLLSLMEERNYDAVDILVPNSDSYRGRLARLAADVATRGIEKSKVSQFDSNDLVNILSFLTSKFREYYLDQGFSIEFGLTGSKMHAVACAAASTAFKLEQIWYVSPDSFDPNRFTQGVGSTRWFIIERTIE